MKQIGEYMVLRELGRGGMGAVYEAQERLSRRPVALKVMHGNIAASPRGRELFVGEMGILARLDHPNVVRLLACQEHGEQLVMVLELMRGETLRQSLQRMTRFAWTDAVIMLRQILSGLGAAHEQKPAVVHRDLKPENVMVTEDTTIKVMDFGIAKVMRDATKATADVGTLQYMAPEQIDGTTIDPRTDLYAAGLVLYEMLTGAPPFTSTSTRALLDAQCTAPVPPLPPEVQHATPPDLVEIMHLLLAKSADGRPSSANAVLQMLSSLPGVPASLSFKPVVGGAGPGNEMSFPGASAWEGSDPGLPGNPPTHGNPGQGAELLSSLPGTGAVQAGPQPTHGAPAGHFPGASQWAPSMPGPMGRTAASAPASSPGSVPPAGAMPGASQWAASQPGAGAVAAPTGPGGSGAAPGWSAGASHPAAGSHHAASAGVPTAVGNATGAPTKSRPVWPFLLIPVVLIAAGVAGVLLMGKDDGASSASASAAPSSGASSSNAASEVPGVPKIPGVPGVTDTPSSGDSPSQGKPPKPLDTEDFGEAVAAACQGGPPISFAPTVPQALVHADDFNKDGTEDVIVEFLQASDPMMSKVIALNGKTMQPLWKLAPDEHRSEVRRYGFHDDLLVQSFGRNIRGIEMATGNTRWEGQLSDDVFWFVVEDDEVYVETIDNVVSAVSLTSGRVTSDVAKPTRIKRLRDEDFPQIEGLEFEASIGDRFCDFTRGFMATCPRSDFALYEKSRGTNIPHMIRYRATTVEWTRKFDSLRDIKGDIVAVVVGSGIVVVSYGDDRIAMHMIETRDGKTRWEQTWKRQLSARAVLPGDGRFYMLAGCMLVVDAKDGRLLSYYR
ncbi:MAG: protein kinase [Myxococcota bacterium]